MVKSNVFKKNCNRGNSFVIKGRLIFTTTLEVKICHIVDRCQDNEIPLFKTIIILFDFYLRF